MKSKRTMLVTSMILDCMPGNDVGSMHDHDDRRIGV